MSKINPDSQSSELAQEAFSTGMSLAARYLIALGIAEFPFLGLPLIKQVFTFIINRLTARVSSGGELFISFKFIDDDKDERNGQYQAALKQWEEVRNNPEVSTEKKNELLEETRKRLGDLIRFPRR